MCSCEDDIVGDEDSTACTHLLVFVEEGKATDGAMQHFLQFVALDAEELLVEDNYLVLVALHDDTE